MNLPDCKKKLIGSDDERAVSPVIGVILMVAITVILAAVIAAFVLDLGDSVGQEAQAGVSLEVDETGDTDELSIEVTSMGNADHVTFGGVASDIDEIEGDDYSFVEDSGDTSLNDVEMTVGNSLTAGPDEVDDDEEADGTVTAIAVIEEDGTETTVASTEVDIDGDP